MAGRALGRVGGNLVTTEQAQEIISLLGGIKLGVQILVAGVLAVAVIKLLED